MKWLRIADMADLALSIYPQKFWFSGGWQHKATLTSMRSLLTELVGMCILCLLSLFPNRTILQLDQSISEIWEATVFSKDPWRGVFCNFPWQLVPNLNNTQYFHNCFPVSPFLTNSVCSFVYLFNFSRFLIIMRKLCNYSSPFTN